MSFVTRYAPSPTGRLHLGHAFSALTVFDAAQAAGGRFLLRIEDLDRARCKAEYEQAIYDDLAWLGLSWEQPARRQSDHMPDYEAALAQLISRDLVYRCFRTRSEILAEIANAPHEREVYIGAPLTANEEAERIGRGEAFAWRLSTERARETLGALTFDDETGTQNVAIARLGDAVIARKDFPASYHLACVCDDALQGITHVIRGEDLRDSAHLHVVLQALLGLPAPIYQHHRLIMDDTGRRLAKRDADEALATLRSRGVTPTQLRARVGL